MKKIANLSIIFLAVSLTILSTNNKLNKALKIETVNPLADIVQCSNVDSITFSVNSDTSNQSAGFIQTIYTADTILTYPTDSIRMTSFEDLSSEKEITESFETLSDHIEETNLVGKPFSIVQSEILSWVTSQKNVEKAILSENETEIEVKYSNGQEAYISFVSLEDSEETSNMYESKAFTTNSSNEEKKFYNIESTSNEEILHNKEILYFKGMPDPMISSLAFGSELGSIQKVIDQSPVDMKLTTNKAFGDLNFLLKGLPSSDIAIVSNTHGASDTGGFQIGDGYLNSSFYPFIKRSFPLFFKNGTLAYYEKRKSVIVKPQILDSFDCGKGIAVMNYCYSQKFGNYVEKLCTREVKKRFIGYIPATHPAGNLRRLEKYMSHLSNGATHSEAIELVNTDKDLESWNSEKFSTSNDGYPDYRLFSITTNNPKAHTDMGVAEVSFTLNGWSNLKKDIESIKIWYKGEPFETPDENCQVITRKIAYSSWVFNEYGLSRWAMPDGNDFFDKEVLEGVNSDELYYCMGFEYNGKTYIGDVKCVHNIRNGITEGDCIDLGLPSGTKWSACNLGASNPAQLGLRAGWGDPTGEATGWKYPGPEERYGGIKPAQDISGSSYDICKAKLGNGWRLPTNRQWVELMDPYYTYWTSYEYNNIRGVRIRSKINGNCIFIPLTDEYLIINWYKGTMVYWTGECNKTIDEEGNASYTGCIVYIQGEWQSSQMYKNILESSRDSHFYFRAVKK